MAKDLYDADIVDVADGYDADIVGGKPAVRRDISAVPEDFRREYVTQQASPALRAWESGKEAVKGVAGLVGKGASVVPALWNQLGPAALAKRFQEGTLLQLPDDLKQTRNEALVRIGSDAIQMGQGVVDKLDLAKRRAMEDKTSIPLALRLAGGLGGEALRQAVLPRTPSEGEIEQAFRQRQLGEMIAKGRQEGEIMPKIMRRVGKADIDVAEAASALPQIAAMVAPGAAAIKGIKPLIPGTAASLAKRSLELGSKPSTAWRATARDLLTSIMKPTTDAELEKLRLAVDSGELLKPIQEIAASSKKAPTTLREFETAAGNAKNIRSQQITNFFSSPAGKAVLPTDSILQAAIEAIEKNPKLNVKGMEALKKRLLDRAQEKYGNQQWTAKELFEHQKDLNALQKAALDKEKVTRKTLLDGSPEKAMEDAVRRKISASLDDHITSTSGSPDNFYRAWGKLNEIEEGVRDAVNSAERSRSGIAAGQKQLRPEEASFGLPFAIRQIGRAVFGRIGADELSTLNANTRKLFERLPKSGKAAPRAPVPPQIGGTPPAAPTPPPPTAPASPVPVSIPAPLSSQAIQQRLALQAAMKQQATAPAAPAGAVTVPPPNMAQVIARQQALARAMPQVQAQAAPVVAASPRPVTTPLKAAIARADAPPQVDPGTIQRINQAVPQSAKPLPTGEELKQMARDLSRLDKALDKAEDALDRGSIGVKDFRAISDERNALYKKIQGLTQ